MIRWCTPLEKESTSQVRAPFLTEACKTDISFKTPIQQIVFPPASDYKELCGIIISASYLILDYFAVRNWSEVHILTCLRSEEKLPFVDQCLTLPSSLSMDSASKYIADTVFAPDASQIATITDQGFWAVYKLSMKKKLAEVVIVGNVELPVLPQGDCRTRWWKMEWNDTSDGLVIARDTSLHLLNVNVNLPLILI